MKKTFFYSIALLMGAMGLISCDNDFEIPPMVYPEAPAGMEANISIADLKQAYWDDARNYCTEIGINEATGEDYIIEGRVVSSDESGNIYKNFIIEDASGALTVSVNMKNIYKTYKFGQKVLIRATGMHIGKYNGLQQLGAPEWYAGGNTWETTFMEEDVLKAHAFQNGLPEPAKVDTAVVTIPEINSYKANTSDLIRWTSRLIRINNVRWEDAGKEFAGSANANRNIIDENGNRLLVRNSAYSSFSYDKLPYGYGDVVGILSFYGTDYQMVLIDANSLINYDPDAGPEPGDMYKKVTTITSGKQYLIVAGTEMAKPIAANKTYGWLYTEAVSPEDDIITDIAPENTFTITSTESGYTIQQADGRYLYQQGTYDSFQIGATVTDADAAWWDIAANADGTFTITNKGMKKWIQYSPGYTSFGSYGSLQEGAVLPSLYEKL